MNAPKKPTYKIKLHKDVQRIDSKRFDDRTKGKIKNKCIELLTHEPEKAGEPLRPPLQRYRKLKVFSDYRVVYKVEKDKVLVFILAVGIRRDSEVYEQALKRLQKTS